jgi:hypothetical protein
MSRPEERKNSACGVAAESEEAASQVVVSSLRRLRERTFVHHVAV